MKKCKKVREIHNGQVFFVTRMIEIAEHKGLEAHREREEERTTAEAANEARAIRAHRTLAADRQKLAF